MSTNMTFAFPSHKMKFLSNLLHLEVQVNLLFKILLTQNETELDISEVICLIVDEGFSFFYGLLPTVILPDSMFDTYKALL